MIAIQRVLHRQGVLRVHVDHHHRRHHRASYASRRTENGVSEERDGDETVLCEKGQKGGGCWLKE